MTEKEIHQILSSYISGTIANDQNLLEAGLNSLKIMELAGMWRKEGIKVKFTVLMEHPTISEWQRILDAAPRNVAAQHKVIHTTLENKPFPLTDVQYAYWIGRADDQCLGGVGCHYYMEFRGRQLNVAQLSRAWTLLLEKHPMLTVRFHRNGTQEYAQVRSGKKLGINDLRSLSLREAEEQISTGRADKMQRKLSVENGENISATLILLPDGASVLQMDFDLLVADAQSLQILLNDLADAYHSQKLDLQNKFNFAQYLEYDAKTKAEEYEKAKAFWQEKVKELPLRPDLVLKCKPEELAVRTYKRRVKYIQKDKFDALKQLAGKHQTTMAMVLLTVYAIVIKKWSTNADFLLNIPIYNRDFTFPNVKHSVADFTNIMLLDVHIKPHSSFHQILKEIQNKFQEYTQYTAYSGVKVQRDLAQYHPGERNFAPVVFACNIDSDIWSEKVIDTFGELHCTASQTPQVWLDFQMYQKGGQLMLTWDTVEELFPDGMIDEMTGALVSLLEKLTVTDWHSFSEFIPIERGICMEETRLIPASQRLQDAFFEMARQYPKQRALTDARTGIGLTYEELAVCARKIAAMLREKGVMPETAVAVTLPRGIQQVEAILGILTMGGCYVPVSVDQPYLRRENVHKNMEIPYVISNNELKKKIPWPENVIVLEIEEMAAYEPFEEAGRNQEDQLAYIILTSGTTGEPKGVEISHYSALNTIYDINQKFHVTGRDKILAVSAIHFDLSVYDMFGLLSVGGELILLDEENYRNPQEWMTYIEKYQICMWNSVPVLYEMLLACAGSRKKVLPLRLALLSGDWIRLDIGTRSKEVMADCKVVGLGGATEASIWSNYFEVPERIPQDWKSIPYGKPLHRQLFRVMDENEKQCPDWVTGELWIGGDGVAMSYRKDSDLTMRKFVVQDGMRWYRTGDFGRFWSDGTIEFLGRMDSQFKLKGYRMEAGEIENALRKLPAIKEAVVKPFKENGKEILAAFLVGYEGIDLPEPDEVRHFLKNRLQDYMIPTVYQAMEKVPLSANGKIDRKQLVWEPTNQRERQGEDLQEDTLLKQLWKQNLKVNEIAEEDDYFEMGGNSLTATVLVEEIRKQMNLSISVGDIFKYPEFAEFQKRLEEYTN